jgi:hypothetical protein
MRGIDYYYSEFQRVLDAVSPAVGQEFNTLLMTNSPREVFLWLEQKRLNGQLPNNLESLLTDFYWEIT